MTAEEAIALPEPCRVAPDLHRPYARPVQQYGRLQGLLRTYQGVVPDETLAPDVFQRLFYLHALGTTTTTIEDVHQVNLVVPRGVAVLQVDVPVQEGRDGAWDAYGLVALVKHAWQRILELARQADNPVILLLIPRQLRVL